METPNAAVFQRAFRKSLKATEEVEWLTKHVEFVHTLLTTEQRRVLAAHYETSEESEREQSWRELLTGVQVERAFEEGIEHRLCCFGSWRVHRGGRR
jgi:hypothetical protein